MITPDNRGESKSCASQVESLVVMVRQEDAQAFLSDSWHFIGIKRVNWGRIYSQEPTEKQVNEPFLFPIKIQRFIERDTGE